ncbi:MAG: hypothetical protein KatS3mg002_1691 [Candidatus Woesearchaeota archaeon]|nr:MAG: hypothetical protein KatS3mg002_1691 [Candidatus Woesearchaeota archaeon]GIX40440.1 MAG: hypothetical protein KatS3mg129_0173 [Leptospiraceae bacterium]
MRRILQIILLLMIVNCGYDIANPFYKEDGFNESAFYACITVMLPRLAAVETREELYRVRDEILLICTINAKMNNPWIDIYNNEGRIRY